MAREKPFFYGWYLLGVGFFCYGFGISPMYYSWGFFLPEMRQEFALSETQSGFVFSVYSYVYHLLGPLVGITMARLGIRSVVGFGSLVGVVGFWLMSRADSFYDCLVAYGILGGIAIGFATILPSQTLASNWFVKYRARAIAVVLTGGGIVGTLVNRYFGPQILQQWNWRTGWLVIAGISLVVGVVGVVFIRSTPEEIGQRPDGETVDPTPEASTPAAEGTFLRAMTGPQWTAAQALGTYQFYVLVALSIAYAAPWSVITVYGRSHLELLGFSTAVAGAVLGWRVFASVGGRLLGSGGDFVPPQRLLALVLLMEGLGTVGLCFVRSEGLANLCVVLVGLGFGTAYVSVPVAYSSFYGRRAFGTTAGTRFAIVGAILPSAPTLAGVLTDWSGSYRLAFLVMASLPLAGAVVAFWLPRPQWRATPVASPAS